MKLDEYIKLCNCQPDQIIEIGGFSSFPSQRWNHSSILIVQFSSVTSRVQLFAIPWTAARQVTLSITNSQSLLKLRSIELVIPSNHLILLSPSSLAFNLSQHQGLFQWVSSSHQVAKVLDFQLQHQSFQWTPRIDLL